MGIIDVERTRNLYNSKAYSENTDNWEDGTAHVRARALYDAIKDAGLLDSVKSLLDVGCGSGGVLAELAKLESLNDVKLEGMDIADEAISISNKLAESKGVAKRVNYRLGGISDLSSKEHWTVISLLHVLEHCPDMKEMLECCFKHSDYVYINVPIEFTPLYAIRGGIPKKQYLKYGHLHFFDEEFFLEWLKQNDFILLSKTYSYDFRTARNTLKSKVMRVLRELSLKFIGPSAIIKLFAGISVGFLDVKKLKCIGI